MTDFIAVTLDPDRQAELSWLSCIDNATQTSPASAFNSGNSLFLWRLS